MPKSDSTDRQRTCKRCKQSLSLASDYWRSWNLHCKQCNAETGQTAIAKQSLAAYLKWYKTPGNRTKAAKRAKAAAAKQQGKSA